VARAMYEDFKKFLDEFGTPRWVVVAIVPPLIAAYLCSIPARAGAPRKSVSVNDLLGALTLGRVAWIIVVGLTLFVGVLLDPLILQITKLVLTDYTPTAQGEVRYSIGPVRIPGFRKTRVGLALAKGTLELRQIRPDLKGVDIRARIVLDRLDEDSRQVAVRWLTSMHFSIRLALMFGVAGTGWLMIAIGGGFVVLIGGVMLLCVALIAYYVKALHDASSYVQAVLVPLRTARDSAKDDDHDRRYL
jgi:hypothetical protein